MSAHLYRIDASSDDLCDIGVLTQGLRRHLVDLPLLSTLVQIGDRQQAYVALRGCEGCGSVARCAAGCRVELLRRTLRSAFGASCRLNYVSKGLAERFYPRVVLARPRTDALALSSQLLRPFNDARLTLYWQPAGTGPQRLAAVLVAGSDGPEPAALLREHGWDTLRVPGPIARYASALFGVYSWPVQLTAVWPGEPALLISSMEWASVQCSPVAKRSSYTTLAPTVFSASGEQTISGIAAMERHEQQVLRAAAYAQLKNILASCTMHVGNRQVPDPEERSVPGMTAAEAAFPSPWPQGPGEGKAAMTPADVELYVGAGLLSPKVMSGNEPGLTRRRLAAVLDERHKEHAGLLLLWFESAGLLVPPVDPAQPYRHPRLFACVDPAAIAAQLRSQPLPTGDDVAAAKANGL